MRLHTGDVREFTLKVDCEKNPLTHRGIEPALAACRSDALPTELHPQGSYVAVLCVGTLEKQHRSGEYVVRYSLTLSLRCANKVVSTKPYVQEFNVVIKGKAGLHRSIPPSLSLSLPLSLSLSLSRSL